MEPRSRIFTPSSVGTHIPSTMDSYTEADISRVKLGTYSTRAGQSPSGADFEPFPVCSGAGTPASWVLGGRRRRLWGLRGPESEISTALSPSGWAAAATHTDVRLYNLTARNIPSYCGSRGLYSVFKTKGVAVDSITVPLKLDKKKAEQVRGIALSNDLLAVITHMRLIVYTYAHLDDLKQPLHEKYLDSTPRTVGILQRGVSDTGREASAWVAIGTSGAGGVELFNYSYISAWSPQGSQPRLACPGNTSWISHISLSPCQSNHEDDFMLLAVSELNHIYCWKIVERHYKVDIKSFWRLDINTHTNELVRNFLLKSMFTLD